MEDYILIVLLLFNLCIFGFFLIKNKRPNYKDKEQRIFKLYQNIEEMIDDFESYISEAKGQIETEKNKLIDLYEKLDIAASNEQAEESFKTENSEIETPVITLKEKVQHPDNRINEVISLYNKGLSKEEIAKELKISRGEVQLILNI